VHCATLASAPSSVAWGTWRLRLPIVEGRPGLNHVLEAWARWPGASEQVAPASDDTIAIAERMLGRRLPGSLRALYASGDGGYHLDGNLMLEPLLSEKPYTGVLTCTKQMHEHGALPQEAVVFGSDGSDGIFSAWLPATPLQSGVPIIDSGIEGGSVALVATDLIPFLVGRTAYYLVLEEADAAAMDVLSIPERFRVTEREASHLNFFFEVRAWADPELPDPTADPHDNPTDVNAIRELYGAYA
jgi:SMI1/KNR4 family protein SUKH-1